MKIKKSHVTLTTPPLWVTSHHTTNVPNLKSL